MAEKLTLIVTCTDRKSAQPGDSLRIGNLPPSPLPQRASRWCDALRKESTRRPLRQLYQGDAWTQALELEATASRAGFEPTLLVASAGLGLVSADEEWPAYAATFSPRHADSIGASGTENREWWRLMTDGQTNLGEQAAGPTILVLSETYATAMTDDLNKLDMRDDVVVFGGSAAVPDHLRVPADRGLRAALGGTSGSLNLRTASAWVNSLPAPALVGQRDHAEWRKWVEETRKPESYSRKLMSDADILDFLRDIRQMQPDISKTRALRTLRDAGSACEQKRFSGLFTTSIRGKL